MNSPIEINGKVFVPVRQAADRFKYSRDHLTRLAKAKKVNAIQAGRLWFVHEQSLENYLADQEVEALARTQILRRQRQAELAVRMGLFGADTNYQATTRHSGVVAVMCTGVLLLLGVVVASHIVPVTTGSLAAVLSVSETTLVAPGPGTDAPMSDVIQPVFSDRPQVVVTDADRVVEKPTVTSKWVQVTP